jgi:hypothetical protein
MKELLDDRDDNDDLEIALVLRPRAVSAARDLLIQLELQRNFIARELRSEVSYLGNALDADRIRELEKQDFLLREREELVDEVIHELQHLEDEKGGQQAVVTRQPRTSMV